MYKIPQSFDGAKLKGRTVEQICYTHNTISISFGLDCSLHIQTTFKLSNGKEDFYSEELYPISTDLGLLKLLEKSITSITINESRNNLVLTFDNDLVLTLHGDDHYESYSIKIGEFEILV